MSRYVIELRPYCKVVQQICESNGQVCIGARSIEYLEELTADYISENFPTIQQDAYDRGYKDGRNVTETQAHDDAYHKGLAEGNDIGYKDGVKDGQNEAWECAKKLFSTMSETEIEKVFPTEWENGFYGLMQMKPQYAIEKLKAYEQKQSDKIKRGDIVNVEGCCDDNLLGVVTKVGEDNCYIMLGDGSGGAWSKDSVVKTGKHIDIEKTLGELRYDS